MVYRDGRKVKDPDSQEEDSGEETTLIPKSLLPDGVKAGDEVRLKIVHGFEDEFEVSYSHSKKPKANDNVAGEPLSLDEDMEELAADA